MPILFALSKGRKVPRPYQAPSSRSSSEPPSPHTGPHEEHEDPAAPPSPTSSERSTSAASSVSPGTGSIAAEHESPPSSNPPSAKPLALPWDSGEKDGGTPSGRIAWDPRQLPRGGGDDDDDDDDDDSSPRRRRPTRAKTFHMRAFEDDEETDWWFASTACPLLAATTAPLANVLSIAALVTPWRVNLSDGTGGVLPDFSGTPYRDPSWCYWLNVVSLTCGFLGNVFLLFNFAGRIRYIIALPATIILLLSATIILVTIVLEVNMVTPPVAPYEAYSQGFWYAVIASAIYFVSSSVLILNMIGYFLGHYHQRFELNDHQRTLIVQTMLFFAWLAGGGAIFSKIESIDAGNTWAFVDGLYFCDVTILTVGFGDLTLTNDLGRGLVFPYTVGGIIMLGLVISSISKFAADMGEENVVWKHADKVRHRTLERTTTDPLELERAEILRKFRATHVPQISAPFDARMFGRVSKRGGAEPNQDSRQSVRSRHSSVIPAVHRRINIVARVKHRQSRITLLRGERDRFNEMRRIQQSTARFKRWWALAVSVAAFMLLWGVGAVIFWKTERYTQDMTYFQALYFCYVALLTIGYGDFAPKSNAGRPFFVVWSLIAVPTMTLLISDMSGTVIDTFKRGSFLVADFTVLLKRDAVSAFLDDHPRLRRWINERREEREQKERLERGMQVVDASALEDGGAGAPAEADDDDDDDARGRNSRSRSRDPGDDDDRDRDRDDDDTAAAAALRPSLEQIAREVESDARRAPDESKLARRLAIAIRKVAADLHMASATADDKRYSFEEWAELTRLMRFTSQSAVEACRDEECDVIDWDWLGENSPLMSKATEPEFVLDRLCESLVRYTRRVERRVQSARKESYAQGRRRSIIAAQAEQVENGGQFLTVRPRRD